VAFRILCCLWFCNAVGLGSGASALSHPCSCITICVQIIYKGHQCSATHRSKHPGIPSLPPFLNHNNVLFQVNMIPNNFSCSCYLVCCSDSTYQCFGICFWWNQLWSFRFCIFCVLNGKSAKHFVAPTDFFFLFPKRLVWFLTMKKEEHF
jgi:hypothetical protein